MPTYRALDITARISTAPTNISSYVHSLGTSDEDPLLSAFEAGGFLREDPIGPEGDERSVVRFIGSEEDMAFLMVEAKDDVSPSNKQQPSTPRRVDSITAPLIRSNLTGSSITESDLSSLPISSPNMFDALYRSPGNENTTSEDTPLKVMSMSQPPSTSPQPGSSSAQAQPQRQQMQPQHQVLMVSVNLGSKAFLTPELRKSFIGKDSRADLKVEILVNGQVAGTTFAHDVGSIKPLNFNDNASLKANERWSGVAKLLEKEVDLRGVNEYKLRSPSGEYLSALSRLPLPKQLAERHIVGTVDIMVTLGLPKKEGSGSSCVTSPLQVRNFTVTSNSAATSHVQTANDGTTFRKTPGGQTPYKNSSNDLSLTAARKRTDNRSKTLEFAASIGIQSVPNMIVGSFINNRGQLKQGKRTLMNRLSDIMRMSEGRSRQRAIEEVQDQAKLAAPLTANYNITSSSSLPPNKKQKTSVAPGSLTQDSISEAEIQSSVATPRSAKKRTPETGSTSKTSGPPSLYKGSALSSMESGVERRGSRKVGERFDEYTFLVGMRIVLV